MHGVGRKEVIETSEEEILESKVNGKWETSWDIYDRWLSSSKKKEMSWLIGGDDYSACLGNVHKEWKVS